MTELEEYLILENINAQYKVVELKCTNFFSFFQ